jgi:acetyl esterase/lipase
VSPRNGARTVAVLAALLGALALAIGGCGTGAEGSASGTGTTVAATPMPTLADQPYTDSPTATQVLDLWVPGDAAAPVPLVVFVHGGGWVEGDKSQVASKLPHLLEQGFAVASIGYRLASEAVFPAAVQDAKAAVRWLRANAATHGIDPDGIAAWGESAGGHLAALLGVTGDQPTAFDDPALGNPDTSSAVQAVVDWFGPADLLALQEQAVDDGACPDPYDHDAGDSYESRWLGASLEGDVAMAELADPVTYIPTATRLPPFSIAHGDRDCVVDIGQSRLLAGALEEAGQHPQVLVLTGAGHMDPRFDAEVLDPTIAWLHLQLGR